MKEFEEITLADARQARSMLSCGSVDIVLLVVFHESEYREAERLVEACGAPDAREVFLLVRLESQQDVVQQYLLKPGFMEAEAEGWFPPLGQRPTPFVRFYGLWNSGDVLYDPVNVMPSLVRARKWIAETYHALRSLKRT